ncbi:MAG TPA: PIN domain-containing protein [Nitrososphaerales archaeon]|nr:PIN domain-containing protein [Nitrososphaerales archaeon]
MKRYIADAVAIARYFEDSLPPGANLAFREAEEGKAEIFIPEIVFGEFIYIALKGRLKVERISDARTIIRELLDEIESSTHLKPVQMSRKGWDHFLESTIPELHDRMIYSIAMSLDSDHSLTIITNDKSLKSVFRTIW